MKSKPIYIVIAEDDADDQLLLHDALIENGLDSIRTSFVQDGQELLDLLVEDSQLPDIILLDLNMPRKDGRESLREIKANKNFSHIPIIVFTTSNNEEDIKYTYREGGSTYITKPALFSDLVDTLGTLKKYWFEKAVLVHR